MGDRFCNHDEKCVKCKALKRPLVKEVMGCCNMLMRFSLHVSATKIVDGTLQEPEPELIIREGAN